MSKALYQVGDVVVIRDSGMIDVGWYAKEYIQHHRVATVKAIFEDSYGIQYALEWPEEFEGGHLCMNNCAPHRGQYVFEKHLELENFEASREVNTVPNIKGYDDGEDTKENNL